jgi:putative tryptophan/tyrosine transport system substrate-binding protein
MHFHGWKRRDFITLFIGAASGWPLIARAQNSTRMRRIAWMDSFHEDDPNAKARVKAFLQVMEKLGWVVGSNLTIDYRWNLFDVERARPAGAEILNLAPDVILCGGTPSALAMQQATRTVPIVFAFVTDPVGQGIVTNLAHPSSNITGFSYFEPTIASKWLELLTEIAPLINRVALMFNPVSSPYSPLYYQSIAAAAPTRVVKTVTVLVRDLSDIEQVMTKLGHEQGNGIIFSPDAFLYQNRALIIELAARHRLPAIYGLPGTAAEGGLIYYVVDIVDLCRKAAAYIDRILRGEKPGDLPVQQPTKFEMTINLKTAKALGLTVPNTLLVSADEVFE